MTWVSDTRDNTIRRNDKRTSRTDGDEDETGDRNETSHGGNDFRHGTGRVDGSSGTMRPERDIVRYPPRDAPGM
jgi:hypothetical protein